MSHRGKQNRAVSTPEELSLVYMPNSQTRSAPAPTPQLPQYQYSRLKAPTVPLDRQRTDNLHFFTLESAVRYIASHCHRHYGTFSRPLMNQYIGDCYVYHHYMETYIRGDKIPHEILNQVFRRVGEYR